MVSCETKACLLLCAPRRLQDGSEEEGRSGMRDEGCHTECDQIPNVWRRTLLLLWSVKSLILEHHQAVMIPLQRAATGQYRLLRVLNNLFHQDLYTLASDTKPVRAGSKYLNLEHQPGLSYFGSATSLLLSSPLH